MRVSWPSGYGVFAGAHSKVLLSEAKLGQFVVRPAPLDFTKPGGPLPAAEIETSTYGTIEGVRSRDYYAGGTYNRLGILDPETTAAGTEVLVNQDTGTVAYDDSVPEDPENPYRVQQAVVAALAQAGLEERSEATSEKRAPTEGADERGAAIKARFAASPELNAADKALIAKLRQAERQVKAHEQAHISAGGGLTSGATYSYQQGPDGRSYVVAGEVSIRSGPASSPEETVIRARKVRRAALAPADPSPADTQVAQAAMRMELLAQAAIRQVNRQQGLEQKSEDSGTNIPMRLGSSLSPELSLAVAEGGLSAGSNIVAIQAENAYGA